MPLPHTGSSLIFDTLIQALEYAEQAEDVIDADLTSSVWEDLHHCVLPAVCQAMDDEDVGRLVDEFMPWVERCRLFFGVIIRAYAYVAQRCVDRLQKSVLDMRSGAVAQRIGFYKTEAWPICQHTLTRTVLMESLPENIELYFDRGA